MKKSLFYRQRSLYLMVLPAIVIIFLFNYLPMYGIVIAFKNYKTGRTFINAPWVGFK